MHDDVYQLYLDEIAAIRPMDTEEESLLLEKLKSGDTTVRTRLMDGLSSVYRGDLQRLTADQGLPMGDLVQEANMAAGHGGQKPVPGRAISKCQVKALAG